MAVIETGLYEQLITRLIANQLALLDRDNFYIQSTKLDKAEAARYLSRYIAETIRFALDELKGDDQVTKQIELSNKIIQLLIKELPDVDISTNLIESEGRLLEAIFSKLDFVYSKFDERVKEIMPYTRLSQSELFTGNNLGLSLDSEIKKEIQSSDEICWLVSFIRYSGIVIFKDQLKDFTDSGKRLRIITTSYMGATDPKAIDFLAGLKNTEIKISYNSEHERLHAKAYLFLRKSGFNTGYIGSSNLSRSALTNGLEWNIKITTQEINHIIAKFQKTFETYWLDRDFETFKEGQDEEKLRQALRLQKSPGLNNFITFFDIPIRPYQQEILEKLSSERFVHHRYRNLVVAATGTGKTVVSAFDYRAFKQIQSTARLLFIAHRKEILQQAQNTFRHVLKDANFGELWVDGIYPDKYNHVFASVQSLSSQLSQLNLSSAFFDFVVIDEVHHIAASSYRPILDKFTPKILLGLTATPERMDGEDILKDFCGVIAAEIRLPEALNSKLLTPFQYFAVSDQVDLSKINWKNGRYEITELSRIYTEDDRRVGDILANCERYLADVHDVRALGFCVSIEHARFMAEKFLLAGLKADYLTSENAVHRESMRDRLRNKEINYLFVRDIFNEGVDLPEIDTVLFLRPTESLTIFLQQLGRGLRLAEKKDFLTVLDFVGNARPEYDFEQKFRALVGKTQTPIIREIEDEFPHLPLGCSIVLEKKAKEIILKNIREATNFSRKHIIIRIQNFRHQSSLPLTFVNFINFQHIEPQIIYRRDGWKRLCFEAGIIGNFNEANEREIIAFIKRLLGCNSISYLSFIKQIINGHMPNSAEQETMAVMLHYDIWQASGPKAGFSFIQESILQLRQNSVMMQELEEVIDWLISKVDFIEKPIKLGFPSPLKLHSRYSRSQILAATELHRFDQASSNREGVAANNNLNIESLLVTLKKSEKDYSPTTLYDDYAINESIFHWQSQNRTSPTSAQGRSYIEHRKNGKKILLFVREQNDDEYGYTMSYVFLGLVDYVSSSGARPMNIEWRLQEPMPASIWKESGKLAVG